MSAIETRFSWLTRGGSPLTLSHHLLRPLMDILEGDILIVGGCVDRPPRPRESRRRAEMLVSVCSVARLPIKETTGLPKEGMSAE